MKDFRIEDYMDQLKVVFDQYPEIAGVVLFGSYLTPYFTERSSLDFGVIFKQPVELFWPLRWIYRKCWGLNGLIW